MNRGKKSPLISIMIPHHGGKKILQECLDSLKSSDYSNLEILVLNNNSPDDSIKKIQLLAIEACNSGKPERTCKSRCGNGISIPC